MKVQPKQYDWEVEALFRSEARDLLKHIKCCDARYNYYDTFNKLCQGFLLLLGAITAFLSFIGLNPSSPLGTNFNTWIGVMVTVYTAIHAFLIKLGFAESAEAWKGAKRQYLKLQKTELPRLFDFLENLNDATKEDQKFTVAKFKEERERMLSKMDDIYYSCEEYSIPPTSLKPLMRIFCCVTETESVKKDFEAPTVTVRNFITEEPSQLNAMYINVSNDLDEDKIAKCHLSPDFVKKSPKWKRPSVKTIKEIVIGNNRVEAEENEEQKEEYTMSSIMNSN